MDKQPYQMTATYQKLNRAKDKIKEYYKEENVFGVYTIDDGETFVGVIIPTFEDIVLNKFLLYERPFPDNLNIVGLDVRYIYQATKDGLPKMVGALYTKNFIINPRYEHIYKNLFIANRDSIRIGIETNNPAPELRTAISKLLRCALNDNSNTVSFIKQLSDAEKLALEALISLVGDEGIVSLYKVAVLAGVSQKTVSSLILKMEINHIAIIESHGLKGTYIKILEDTLLNIRTKSF